ncbi:MAG: hypothetical protein IT287_00385 [Bdellovibrionaceae bacterium]|nr:hypothetical protein [Pseudobdellovibrionaceae bacterium]
MLAGLQLLHKLRPESGDLEKIAGVYPVFQTCLRLIQLRWGEDSLVVPKGFDLLTGEKAYQFLLETVCGLHSPVVGETEVFGQFKNFKNNNSWSYQLQLVLDNVITDTKRTRDQFLKDLGGQSYGSVVRKHAREFKSVAFVGAGAFTLELLPWVYKEGKQITLYVRNLDKALALKERFPMISICDLNSQKISADMVIVAAPVTASQLQEIIAADTQLVMDLRGESRTEACKTFKRYIPLEDIFRIIEIQQKQILIVKAQALEHISELTLKRSLFEMMRPFGWDDICVW